MRNITFKKNILPHIVAVITFLIIVFVYFNPVFLTNKTIYQNDILQWEGGARELLDYRDQTSEEGLWSNSMFSGMPAYLVNTHFSGDLFLYVKEFLSIFLPHPANQSFTAMVCFYILLLAFRVRPYLAIVGAIAFGLNSYNLINIEAGHNMKGWAIAYMPLVLAGIHLSFSAKNRTEKIMGYALTALALALHIRTNHLQMTYYLLLIVLIYGLFQLIYFIRQKKATSFLKTTGILAIVAILAVGSSFGKLWTVYEYGKYSIRGQKELVAENDAAAESGLNREYAFQWSNGVAETFTLLVPYFYGGATTEPLEDDSEFAEVLRQNGVTGPQLQQYLANAPTYWGDQPFTSGPIYVGAIVCLLFIIGLFFVEKPIRYWLLAATILSLMLSWGKNFETFNYFMFDYFPGYNKFRSVSMAITIALICMPLLGFVGLQRLFDSIWNKENKRNLLIAGAIAGGLALFFALFAGIFSFEGLRDAQLPEVLKGAIENDREALLRGDAWRSFILIALSLGVIYFYMEKKLSLLLGTLLLGLLVIFDLWTVDKRYLNEENYVRNPRKQFFAQTEADQYILTDKELSYRVFNLQSPWQEARTSYYHQSLGGYHGAKMRRYQDLIDNCLGSEYAILIESLQKGNYDLAGYPVLNMLNAKYLVAGPGKNAVLKNDNALGNAWLVNKIEKVSSPNQEMETLCTLNTENEAVVDASKFDVPSEAYNASGTVDLAEFKPNYLKYTADVSDKAFVVFSEIYYPIGWTAYIDGQEANYVRANYVLRAMEVPAGKHTIEFKFHPQSYEVGNTIMWISSILLLILIIGGMVYGIKNATAEKHKVTA